MIQSRFVNQVISREAREELSKVSRKREGSGGKKQDVDGSLMRSKSDIVATELSIKKVATEMSSIKKEKHLDVMDDWQRDEIGVDEVASEEVEGVNNDDLDHALAEADLGFMMWPPREFEPL